MKTLLNLSSNKWQSLITQPKDQSLTNQKKNQQQKDNAKDTIKKKKSSKLFLAKETMTTLSFLEHKEQEEL